VRYKFVAQAVAEGSVRVRYTPTDMNLADVLTKAVPAATFERLVKLCLDSKRGEFYVKVGDEKVNYVSDEKTWMVTGHVVRETKYFVHVSTHTMGGC
jgi:hypothetical protein